MLGLLGFLGLSLEGCSVCFGSSSFPLGALVALALCNFGLDIQYPTQTMRKCSGAQSLSRKIKALVSWILGDYWMITRTILDGYLGYILGYSIILGYSGILGYRTVRRSVVQSQTRTIHPSPNRQCGVMKQASSNICRPLWCQGL